MPVNASQRSGDVQSVRRALQLLETVGDVGSVGVSELAKELGLAVSTVHNLLRTLVHRGYLVNQSGRYRLGPAITVLSSQWDPVHSLAESARPKLLEVSARTGQATLATVLVGVDARLVAYTPAPGPVTASSPGWTREDPLHLATGRVMVAMTRQSDWPEFIRRGGSVEPERSTSAWMSELAAVAESGVCVKQAHDQEATVSVAVPVWTAGDRVICSVGCSTPGYYASDELVQRVLDALWEASMEFSAELGCSPLPLPKPARPADLAAWHEPRG